MAGPGRTQSSSHGGHATGGVRGEGKEGGKALHQPEHFIWPSARAVYQLPAVTSFYGQEKWETTSNKRDLLGIFKSVKSLLQKYNEDMEYHHVVYHRFLHHFMLFRQGG